MNYIIKLYKLKATRHSKLMYFERRSTLEIHFVLNIDGKVTAIEVKFRKYN